MKSFALQQLDCVECKMHWCTVLLKYKVVINDAIIASNIDSKTSQQYYRH